MLKPLFAFRPVTSLVPNTGIQFLDFGLDETRVARVRRSFWPEKSPLVPGDAKSERQRVVLHPLSDDDDGNPHYLEAFGATPRPAPAEECYSLASTQALEILEGQWLPIPYLRVREGESGSGDRFDLGPTNWARARVCRLPEADAGGNSHRVLLAFDTLLLLRNPSAPYAAPEPNDAVDGMRFAFVDDTLQIQSFLALDWVRDWLEEAWLEGLSRKRGRAQALDDLPPGTPSAGYLALLAAFGKGLDLPQLRFVDTVSAQTGTARIDVDPVIDVDLVIDVGNSRTCGILIERPQGHEGVDISQAYRLELRDLSRPEQVYSDPFASRIEFAPASFGRLNHSRRSGRRQDAFWWPSPVRIGPEAAQLASTGDGTEGTSGLSSAKRYLWDEEKRPLPWTNARGSLPKASRIPGITGPMTAKLTEKGDLAHGKSPGLQPLYSRSSLYSLMIAELLSHALGQINAVAVREQRAHTDLPRRLRSLILTLPSATPIAEQRIIRRRIENALALVWQTNGWPDDDPIHPRPTLKLDWDEATATHLVWLYNEISHKFRGNAYDVFGLYGQDTPDGRAIRVASMDIGGGTTDLMIIEHQIRESDSQTIQPRQLFREGFRQAGDDIVRTVIEDVVLPGLAQALAAAGISRPDHLLTDLFGGNLVGLNQQQQAQRALAVNQILVPAAIGLMAAYEETDPRHPVPGHRLHLVDLLPEGAPSPAARGYIELAAGSGGAGGFSLEQVELVAEPGAMEGVVNSVARGMIEDMCDVIRTYGCDILLLTGRPSRLPIVRDLILSNLPLTPDRVIGMDRYEVGGWYPFRSSSFRIPDPKSTAVVGAMLCQVCEGMARGFVFRASSLKMRSTARHLGIMDLNGQILDRSVLLRNADLDTGANMPDSFRLSLSGPTMIGFRQLPLERWKTSPLYFAYLKNPSRLSDPKNPLRTPLEVDVGRRHQKLEDDEMGHEDFEIIDAVDAEGRSCRGEVALRLQTMPLDQETAGGYWLDTGILRTAGLKWS